MTATTTALRVPDTIVSVDLDDVACYHGIHGLSPPGPEQAGAVLEACLPRFLDLFATANVRATFFVIGRDLERDLAGAGRGAELLRQAFSDGHELANHSYSHGYDMSVWDDERIVDDLRACDGLLRQLGAEPCGFRAPGYTHDRRLLQHVADIGYSYDSSSLPSLPYWWAKVLVLAAMAAVGRRSQSMARGWRSFAGKRAPHRRTDVPLWEFPMSVTPVLRAPLIGTTLLAAADSISSRLRKTAGRIEHLHLELHGLDLADPERDGFVPHLLSRQPELRVPLATKRERLTSLLRERGGGWPIARSLPACGAFGSGP